MPIANLIPEEFPFRDVMSTFLREYGACATYWYVPKARALNDENVGIMCAILRTVFEHYIGREWNQETQDELLEQLVGGDILDPYKEDATITDRTALSRIVKKLLETLGFLWVPADGEIIITDAGLDAIIADDPRPIVEGQIAKIQYPNPSIVGSYRQDFQGILPHLFLLQVLTRTDYYVTRDEYDLFLNLAHSQDDLTRVVRYVRFWRDLTPNERDQLLEIAQNIPMRTVSMRQPMLLNDVPIESSGPTRYGRIRRSSPYQRSFYAYPSYLTETAVDSQTRILCTEQDVVDALVGEKTEGLKIAGFESMADWFAYFGDPEQQPSWFTYLTLQIEKAASEETARQIVEESEAELTADESEAIQRLQVEKGIETFYVGRLEMLEAGLALVEDGRQYSTPIGRMDLLCHGSDGKYVVVEIKANEAEDSAFGQILRYMGYVHRNMEDGRNNVRGILLAGRFSQKARYSRIGLLREDYKEVIKFREHGLNVQNT